MCVILLSSMRRGHCCVIATVTVFGFLMICPPQGSNASAFTSFSKFIKLPNEYRKLVPMTPIYSMVKTSIACALHCFKENGCTCFVFHISSLQCELGSEIVFDINGSPGELYSVPIDIPIIIIPETLTYAAATTRCQDLGAKLFSMKTVDRWNFLASKVTGRTWIGLDDLDDEKTFRWADDDSLLDGDFANLVFKPGEPSDTIGWEDCVDLYEPSDPGHPFINDDKCFMPKNVICELV